MRNPPAKFTRGPKATVEKLNGIIDAVRQNKVVAGQGIRLRETSEGLMVSIDPKILVSAGLANANLFAGANGDKPSGGGGDSQVPGYSPSPDRRPGEKTNEPQPAQPSEPYVPPGTPGGPWGGVSPGSQYPPLQWVTFTLPDAEIFDGYTTSLFAIGGDGIYSFEITGGALPPGLTLTGNTISGVPTSLGNYSVTITVYSDGESKAAQFSMMVTATGAVKIIGTNFLGSAFWLDRTTQSTTLTIAGGTGPYAVVVGSGTLSPWYRWVVTGTNAPRPPSMAYFAESTIYENNVQIQAIPTFDVQNRGGILPQTDVYYQRMAGYSPQGPRRMSVTVFDSTGASATKTVVLDILWDTSRYVAVSAGPSLGSAFVNYPLWIDKSMYDSSPSSYTLWPSSNWPYVT